MSSTVGVSPRKYIDAAGGATAERRSSCSARRAGVGFAVAEQNSILRCATQFCHCRMQHIRLRFACGKRVAANEHIKIALQIEPE